MRRLTMFLCALALLLASPAVVAAAQDEPDPSDAVTYTACLKKDGKLHRVALGELPAKECGKDDQQISWSATGQLTAMVLDDPEAAFREANVLTHMFGMEMRLSAQAAAMEERLFAQSAAMEERLYAQTADMETRLNARLGILQTDLDAAHEKLDEILAAVNASEIEMYQVICGEVEVPIEFAIGLHGEIGAGIQLGLDAEAVWEGTAGFGANAGFYTDICVEVPLYAVDSNDQLFEFTGDTNEFDELIAAIASPGQSLVPLFAEVYGQLMPTPEQSFDALGNVIRAATGFDIETGLTGEPDLALLARPDILLDPIVPPVVDALEDYLPGLIADTISDPCAVFANMPLVDSIQEDTYGWICDMPSDIFKTVADGVAAIEDVVGAIDDAVGDLGNVLLDVEDVVDDIFGSIFDLANLLVPGGEEGCTIGAFGICLI